MIVTMYSVVSTTVDFIVKLDSDLFPLISEDPSILETEALHFNATA